MPDVSIFPNKTLKERTIPSATFYSELSGRSKTPNQALNPTISIDNVKSNRINAQHCFAEFR